jgi:hypothetical protein
VQVESDISDFESFSAIGLEVCFGVPWLSFLIKVFRTASHSAAYHSTSQHRVA